MFKRRLVMYLLYGLGFLGVYSGIVVGLGRFPSWLLFAILLISLGKDLVDEYCIQQGGEPLAYGSIEHNPSNIVLLGFLLGDLIQPTGVIAGISTEMLAVAAAFADFLLDGSQDVRHWC